MPFKPPSAARALSKQHSALAARPSQILYHTPEVLHMLHERAHSVQALITEQRQKLRRFEHKVALLAQALVAQFGVVLPAKRRAPPMPPLPPTRCINDYLQYLGVVVGVTEKEMDSLLDYSIALDRIVDKCKPDWVHGAQG